MNQEHQKYSSNARTPWGLAALLGSLTAMSAMSIDMYLPSLPAMGQSLHASPPQMQASVTIFLAGMAIGQIFYGSASDRLGRRGPMIAGVIIFVISCIFCALATSIHELIVFRGLQALGACAGGVVSRAVVRDKFNHTETARMLSLLALITGVAPICAPILGGVILELAGWRANFWAMAVFGVIVGLAAFLWMRETRGQVNVIFPPESVLASYGNLLCQPRVLGYALAGGLNGATVFTYVTSAPDLLIRSYHVRPEHFGWIFAVNAAGLIGAGQVNRHILRRLAPDQVLRGAGATSVGISIGLMFFGISGLGGQWTVFPLLFCLLCTYGFIQGNTFAGALGTDPTRAGSISALMGTASFGTGALVSGLVALFHDGSPRPMVVSMFVTMALSTLVLRLVVFPGNLKVQQHS